MNLISEITGIKDEYNKNIKELRFNVFSKGVKDDMISICKNEPYNYQKSTSTKRH